MRILLDLQACQASSMNRGIGRYSLALALAIARNGAAHDVSVIVNSAFPDSAAAIRAAFSGLLPAAAMQSFATPLPTAEGDPRNRWRLHAAERIREHFLAAQRPDIVHVSSLFEGLGDDSVNSVLHGDGRFETAVTLYDLIPLLRKERYLADPNVAAWYHRKLDSLKRAELLVAISAHAREEALAALGLAPERVVNISSAADPMFRQKALAPAERHDLLARFGLRRQFIMYTGGIDYRKNIEGLVAAYAALPGDMRRQHQLAVVCSVRDPDRVRLQRLAAKLGLAADDLVLTGFVSDDDLVALYNCTALFVFPSLHEGFGLPVLEAMACGAPVIGSNSSSIPEVIGRADAMFDPASVPAMAAAMAQVLGDQSFAQALRTHGLAQASLFSWDASARRALAAFEEVHERGIATRAVPVKAAVLARPRLALVMAHMPGPGQAGLAGLAGYDDIDLVLAQGPHGPGTRTLAWFDAHAGNYDRIVYQLGNTPAHAPLRELIERHPGLVVLHDFFLGAAVEDGAWRRILYLDHGYAALAEAMASGRLSASRAYPCNRAVLERALGIIVHDPALADLARDWYGAAAAQAWRIVPADAGLRDAIETLMCDGPGATQDQLVHAIACIAGQNSHGDRLQTAAAIAANRRRTGPRQLLVDVTGLAEGAGMVRALIAGAPTGWRVEPVRHDGKRYRYARAWTLNLLGCEDTALDDAVADAGAGDILLGAGPPGAAVFPPAWQACGVGHQPGAAQDGVAEVLARLA